MNSDSTIGIETEDRNDTRPILIVPYMWIGDFVRGHTVVRVLKQRWPNRPVDLLTTSLCAPWSITCRAFAPGSSGICRAAGLRSRGSGGWRRNCAPAAMELLWSCPAPGRQRSRRHWPVSRNGWVSSAKPGSGSSIRCAGARRPCPASSTRTPRWHCRPARRYRRNGRCRSSGFRPVKPAVGGWPTGSEPDRRSRWHPVGRGLQALDLLWRSGPAPGRTRPRRLGRRRPRREGAGAGDRGRRRFRRP